MRPDGEEPPQLDPRGLRRRVVVTGLLTFALFLVLAYVLTAFDLSQAWLVPGLVVLWLLVTRPLLAPVREVTGLRRRLAYQAYLEQRGRQDG